MAKWHGKIGYNIKTKEIRPGYWDEEIVEKEKRGDLIKLTRRLESSGNANDNVVISNVISIVADPFVNEHLHSILYVEFMGAKWKVASIDASQRPRLNLTLGGLYNG